tara:strand:+ start:484 stop:672 length:189 start_codon:yes stop_codon:yes gene_type:complete
MPRPAARFPCQTYRAPRAVRRATFAPGQRDIAYDPRTANRSSRSSNRAPPPSPPVVDPRPVV